MRCRKCVYCSMSSDEILRALTVTAAASVRDMYITFLIFLALVEALESKHMDFKIKAS